MVVTELGPPIPLLRMFDVEATKAFYIGFLGFEVAFEHRFSPDAPLYMAVRRGACELHLSEHHGDATPGGHLRIAVRDIDGYQQGLAASSYRYARPGPPERQPWGLREFQVTDPSGNRLTFHEAS